LSKHLTPYPSQYIAWLLSRRVGADSADRLTDKVGLGKTLESRLDRKMQITAVFAMQWSLQ